MSRLPIHAPNHGGVTDTNDEPPRSSPPSETVASSRTIVPVEVEFRRRLAVGFKVRIYPNGFTDDEFGFGPRLDFNRPAEITYGASVSYIFKQAPRGF